jgi:hypothetical protein
MSASFTKLPAQQEAIRAKCFHPSGTFVEFPVEDVETSIPARFEKIVRRDPGHWAIKREHRGWSYRELGEAANVIARAVLAIPLDEAVAVRIICDNDAPLAAAMIGGSARVRPEYRGRARVRPEY